MAASVPSAPPTWRPRRGVLSILISLALVAAYAAQLLVIVPKTYSAYLFLSGYGMKSGHLWELFTCQLFHCPRSLAFGLAHLLINLAGLWCIGRAVEARLGFWRFAMLYLGTGLAGAVAQGMVAVTGYLLPESVTGPADWLIARFGESVGASIGLCGVFAVFCLDRGSAPVRILGLFPVSGRWLLWLAVAIGVLLVAVPTESSFAHVGHLTGLLAGVLSFRFLKPGMKSCSSL